MSNRQKKRRRSKNADIGIPKVVPAVPPSMQVRTGPGHVILNFNQPVESIQLEEPEAKKLVRALLDGLADAKRKRLARLQEMGFGDLVQEGES